MEYLLELRKRLLACTLVTLFFFIPLCFFANPLYQGLSQPLLSQLPASHLISTSITAPLLVPIKFVFLVSLFLLIPFFCYHFWQFVSPALYSKEKKITWVLMLPSVILFYLGTLFAYFVVLPIVFKFFIHTTPAGVTLLPEIGQYLNFALQILFAFGLAFEVPILVWVLVHCHLATIKQLRGARRYVIVGAFVAGMLFTPPDILSQFLLAVPLWLLFEVGLLFAAIF